MSEEMVIFVRTFDLLHWLLPKSERFPKLYRSTVTQRLMDAALDVQESLLLAEAYRDKIRQRHLRAADAHLSKVRLYLRLVHGWGWLSVGQYEHVSRMVAEIGRLLGGWIKARSINLIAIRRGRGGTGGVYIVGSPDDLAKSPVSPKWGGRGGSESRPRPGFYICLLRAMPLMPPRYVCTMNKTTKVSETFVVYLLNLKTVSCQTGHLSTKGTCAISSLLEPRLISRADEHKLEAAAYGGAATRFPKASTHPFDGGEFGNLEKGNCLAGAGGDRPEQRTQ